MQAKRCDLADYRREIIKDRLTVRVEKSRTDESWIGKKESIRTENGAGYIYPLSTTLESQVSSPQKSKSRLGRIATGEPDWAGNPLGDLSA